jgi:hypothetical protein
MSHDQNSTMRQAGSAVALCDLGLTGHEKRAGIISGVSNLAGRPFAWAGRKLFGQLGHAGVAEGGAIARAGVPEATRTGVLNFGKGLAGEMGGFGLVSGGIEAAMAEPEDRVRAFGRGFGTGAVQGLGWGVGTRAVGGAMGKLMPKGRFAELEKTKLLGKEAPRTAAGAIDWSTRGKALGAKALPWVGGFAGSEVVGAPFGQSMLFNKQDPQRPAYTYPQAYGPMVGMQPGDPYGAGTAADMSLVPRY